MYNDLALRERICESLTVTDIPSEYAKPRMPSIASLQRHAFDFVARECNKTITSVLTEAVQQRPAQSARTASYCYPHATSDLSARYMPHA